MDKELANQIGLEITAAVRVIADKHGLKVTSSRGTFDPAGSLTSRITMESGDVKRIEFERYADSLGLKAEDFGKAFARGGRRFVVAGVTKRFGKKPIICTNLQGAEFVFTVDAVKLGLAVTA